MNDNPTDAAPFDLKAAFDAAQSEASRLAVLLMGASVDGADDNEPAHDKDGA